MSNVVLFAGTTEGRLLAKRLEKENFHVEVCVATEYGVKLLEEQGDQNIHQGRMDEEQIRQYLRERTCMAVVDATHPFARVATQNIRNAAQKENIPYFRFARQTTLTQSERQEVSEFINVQECVSALLETEGRILLTTGSKELSVFCREEALRKRLVVRVLPGRESIDYCMENGLNGRQIIAMQGPFSMEMNVAIIHQYEIACMVTKESGKNGGVSEKIQAAKACGIRCFVLKNPEQEGTGGCDEQQLVKELQRLSAQIPKKKAHMKVTLGGIGTGNEEFMTVALQKQLQRTDYLFGAARMLQGLTPRKEKYPYYLEQDIVPCLEKIQREQTGELSATILFSGDTGFYSGCEKLVKCLKKMENLELEVLPGISSLSAFCAKLQIPWQDMDIVSAHGVEEEVWMTRVMHAARRKRKVFLLTAGAQEIQKLGHMLCEQGMEEQVRIYVGYQLSYPEEELLSLSASQCERVQRKGLYVAVLLWKETAEKEQRTHGIPDAYFLRGDVPMTKEEIREISVSKLRLADDSIVYDIGSGTGSVAVEMALLLPESHVYAVESNPEAVALIKRNLEKFGVHNVTTISGMAPEALAELPKPTHAFIGGSKGNMDAIIRTLLAKNPRIRIVANAVSMESSSELMRLFEKYQLTEVDITTVTVAKAHAVGNYHMMQGANPVTIFAGQGSE